MASWVDRETGETQDEVPFEELYDAVVLDLTEAKLALREAKDGLKEAKQTVDDLLKRLTELRKDRNRPHQLPLAGAGRRER